MIGFALTDVADHKTLAFEHDLGLSTRDAAFGIGQRQLIGISATDRAALRSEHGRDRCVIGSSFSETARTVIFMGERTPRRRRQPERSSSSRS
jgi:hypothetical protein